MGERKMTPEREAEILAQMTEQARSATEYMLRRDAGSSQPARDGETRGLQYGVWHQVCPECGAPRLSPNVDRGQLQCDDCGHTEVVLNTPARDGETLSDLILLGRIAHLLLGGEDGTPFDRDELHRAAKSVAALRAELADARADTAQREIEQRAADYLAGACSRYVHQGWLGARSEIGDALLDYASTRYGDSNPIGGVDATYQKLRAARAASGEDASNQQTGRDRQETDRNG